MKKMVAGLVIVALISSGFTYGILRLYPVNSNSQNIGTDYQTEIQNLNSSFEQLSGAFDGLNASLARLSSDLNDSNESLKQDLLEINENMSTLQNNISSFQQAISDLRGQMNATEDGVHDVESEMESISEGISATETEVTELSERILVVASNATQIIEDLGIIQSDISTLKGNMQNVQTQVAGILYDLSTLETKVSLLESRTNELENRVDALNSTDKIVVRVNFLEFTILDTLTIPPPLPADYLFDVGLYILTENGQYQYPSVASARSGHSRFVRPTYVELTMRNGSEYNGEPLFIHLGDEVHVYIVAYYHLDDAVLDIQPDPFYGPQSIAAPWNEAGSQLWIPYSTGTVKSGSANGEGDGFLADTRDAYLRYKIETFYG